MDRKLKERITGAALLVLCAVIVIPWLLDGRVAPDQFEKSITIPPPGGGSSNVRTIMLDANADASAPVTAAPSPPRTVNIEAPAPVAQTPRPDASETRNDTAADKPPAPVTATVLEPPSPAPVAAQRQPPAPEATAPPPARIDRPDPTAGWAVQVGSFASQANANKLTAQLVNLEYKAFVSRKRLNGRVMYRVRVGPRATREEANDLAERLRIDRQPVRVVEHPG